MTERIERLRLGSRRMGEMIVEMEEVNGGIYTEVVEEIKLSMIIICFRSRESLGISDKHMGI